MNDSLDEEVITENDEEKQILEFELLLINPHVFKSMQFLLFEQITDSSYAFLRFLRFLSKLPRWLFLIQKLPYPTYQFSNHLEQWLLAYQAYPVAIDPRLASICQNPISTEHTSVSSLLGLFLIDLHKRLTSRQYQTKCYHDAVESEKNHLECTTLINLLCDRHVKLVVLRMDLSYQKHIADTKTFEDLRDHLNKMRNNARHNDTIFKGLDGYVFKVEYGLEKNIHAHVFFFFDGNKRLGSSDVFHAEQIKRYWEDQITDGEGFAWNCNARKKKYRYNGIGLVTRDDIEKRTYLISAMKYLCKKERQAIKPRNKPQTKTLTKSDLRNYNPNLGRPTLK